jgi:hypothetical protein
MPRPPNARETLTLGCVLGPLVTGGAYLVMWLLPGSDAWTWREHTKLVAACLAGGVVLARILGMMGHRQAVNAFIAGHQEREFARYMEKEERGAPIDPSIPPPPTPLEENDPSGF